MAVLTPREQAIRDRVEALIRVMEPGLDLVLAAADRVSRLAERETSWTPPTGAGLPGADRSRSPE